MRKGGRNGKCVRKKREQATCRVEKTESVRKNGRQLNVCGKKRETTESV